MSQTLKFGNKTWATKVGSTLAYNDENGNYKPLPFAFTRSTSATRVNKEGLIEVVTNDRPRIDYTDTSDGVLLLEKAATNLVTYSEAFDNSYWTKGGSSVVSGFTSPSGDTSAFKLVEDTSNSSHSLQSSYVGAASGADTFSVFAKSDGRFNFSIVEDAYTGINVIVNLQDGTITTTAQQANIISLKNGWYRIDVTRADNSNPSRWLISLLDSSNNASYQGDGTSGLYIYGAQLEVGNASSYIPTQGSASTRVAETASGAGNSEVFNDSEGVLFADISALANDLTNRQSCINDNSTSDRVMINLHATSNQIQGYITNGSGEQADMRYVVSDTTLSNKIAVKYKLNDCALWVNGFEVATDTSATMPVGLQQYNYNNSTGSLPFYGKTKEIGYYNTALTDLELETLTSYKSWTSMVNELNLNIIYNG